MKYKDYAYYAYVAGLLDGEGCIHIDKKNPRNGAVNPGYTLRVFVNMCDGRAIDFLHGFCGGHVRIQYRAHGNRNMCYQWYIECGKAEELLKKCLPFLRTKKKQAELAIQFRTRQKKYTEEQRNTKTTKGTGTLPYPKHAIDFFEECKLKMQDLKKELESPKSVSETKRVNSL